VHGRIRQTEDEDDAAEQGTSGARVNNLAEKIAALSKKRGRYGEMLKQLQRTGEDQISLTDPDSRAMAAHTHVAVLLVLKKAERMEADVDFVQRYRSGTERRMWMGRKRTWRARECPSCGTRRIKDS
jgi:hypothetical protein